MNRSNTVVICVPAQGEPSGTATTGYGLVCKPRSMFKKFFCYCHVSCKENMSPRCSAVFNGAVVKIVISCIIIAEPWNIGCLCCEKRPDGICSTSTCGLYFYKKQQNVNYFFKNTKYYRVTDGEINKPMYKKNTNIYTTMP